MFPQLVDAWHGGLTEFSVYFLRILFLPLLVYNIFWSARTCLTFVRNQMLEIAMPSMMVMLFSLGIVVRQVMVLTSYPQENVGPMALLSLCLSILASVLATTAHHYNLAAKFSSFYWMMKGDYFHTALRAADLARLDAEYMEGVLDNAETDVAVRLAHKAMSNDAN